VILACSKMDIVDNKVARMIVGRQLVTMTMIEQIIATVV